MSTTLHISNLPFSATEQSLASQFGRYGTVLAARITLDPATGRSTGRGFIRMMSGGDAQNAMNELNETDYDGRRISIRRAITPAPSDD